MPGSGVHSSGSSAEPLTRRWGGAREGLEGACARGEALQAGSARALLPFWRNACSWSPEGSLRGGGRAPRGGCGHGRAAVCLGGRRGGSWGTHTDCPRSYVGSAPRGLSPTRTLAWEPREGCVQGRAPLGASRQRGRAGGRGSPRGSGSGRGWSPLPGTHLSSGGHSRPEASGARL